MLINQSNQMLQYTDRFPIRLLSLPSEQRHMVERLKSNRQRHQRSITEPKQSQLQPSNLNASFLSSYRLHTEEMDCNRSDKRHNPAPHSIELKSTIHAKPDHRRTPRKLSIQEESPVRSRLSVLKELMQRNSPFDLSRYAHLPNQSIKLQTSLPKPERINGYRIFRSHFERSRRERQLRGALIVNRVKQFKDLNVIIRRISSSKAVPL